VRILAIGFRGLPGIQGGVETHAENLYPILANLGCQVEVVVRTPYMGSRLIRNWKGIRLRRIWSPRSKGLEAIVHTFLCVLYAARSRPDVLHIQAIGPALMTPLARLFGIRVVVTHHGPDYDRQKWGAFAKWVLQLGEFLGMRFSNGRIVISEVIRALVARKHKSETTLIPNGVVLPELPKTTGSVRRFGLSPGKYILLVSRLVPEKRHLDLIESFRRADLSDWKLAIVGGADHADAYSQQVLRVASMTPGVVCTGLQRGLDLAELYAHAGLFVLPSSHEGLPIAMLEALSYGLPVLASDIPANLEVGLPLDNYFPLGNVAALAEKLTRFTDVSLTESDRDARRNWVIARYNWEVIAQQTLEVYKSARA
jgi:glycosyltransferase involved in cell wall biosynthesis